MHPHVPGMPPSSPGAERRSREAPKQKSFDAIFLSRSAVRKAEARRNGGFRLVQTPDRFNLKKTERSASLLYPVHLPKAFLETF